MFSNRVQNLSGSEIRAAFKALSNENLISFAGGMPSPEMFPKEEFAELSAKILHDNKSLTYGITEGYPPLIEYVSTEASRPCAITAGGQQAIDLTAKILLNEGDVVITESPSFVGALNCFRSYGAQIVGAKMENDGICIEEVERILKSNKVKLIYVIPNFQNPSGATMSIGKRQKLIDLAQKHGAYILEDDPYGKLRFSGEFLPKIADISDYSKIIYTGSFSKTLAPGLRVGFVSADKEILEKIIICKQTADVHTNCFSQMLVSEYIKNHDYEAHIKKAQEFYKAKCQLMVDCLGDVCDYTIPQGGLFLWLTWQNGKSGREIAELALEKGIAVVSGAAFTPNNEDIKAIRLNYSGSSNDDIKLGIEKLAALF